MNRQGIDPCHGSCIASLRTARGFFHERNAVVAVEFAMIGAPLLLIILEIFQSALFVYCSGMLDHAAAAARQIMTGSVQNGSLTAAQFRTNLLCPQLPATMPCGNVIVNLRTFFGPGSIVVVDIVFNYTPIFGFGLIGTIPIARSAYVAPRYVPLIKYAVVSGDDGAGAECPGY